MKKHKKNKASGITLIALVVTIIVLLILAGISIMMLTGDNGILNRAGEAKDTTLLFGIQWDLVLKYLNNNGVSVSDLTSDSRNLGNYSNTANVTLRGGKYTQCMNSSYQSTFNIWHAYTENLENIVNNKVFNNASMPKSVLLTTMAKQNINDLAGNLYELTLEKNYNSNYPCSVRGGGFGQEGSYNPASLRSGNSTTFSDNGDDRIPRFTLLKK